MRRFTWLIVTSVAVAVGVGSFALTRAQAPPPPTPPRPLSPAVLAIIDDLHTFSTLRVAVATPIRRSRSAPPDTAIRGVFQADAQGQLVFDTLYRERFSLLDGHTVQMHNPARIEGPFAPVDLQGKVPLVQQLWNGIRSGELSWLGRQPFDYGLNRRHSQRDWAEVLVPYPWAEGWHVFLLMLHEEPRMLDMYPPVGDPQRFQILTWEVDVQLDPGTFTPQARAEVSPHYPDNEL